MKNVWKTAGSVLLILALAFALAACGGTDVEEPIVEEPIVQEEPVVTDDPQLLAFIDTYGTEFVEGFETSFSKSSGMSCECTLEADKTELICTCLITGLNDVPDSAKTQLQEIYDGMKDDLKTGFQPIKDQVPTLTAVTFMICEEDGDLLAEINLEME